MPWMKTRIGLSTSKPSKLAGVASVRPGLARGVLPGVQAGAGLEAALDDADEGLGGKPGRKLHRKIDPEVSRQRLSGRWAIRPGCSSESAILSLASIAGRAACLPPIP